MLTVPRSWAVDQMYVVTSVDVSEESTGPDTDNRTVYGTLGPDVQNVDLHTMTRFTTSSSDPDVVRADGVCVTNGWTSTGLKARYMLDGSPSAVYAWLPLDGTAYRPDRQQFTPLKIIMWSAWYQPGKTTITGIPPFTYECKLRFARGFSLNRSNWTTFRMTINTAPLGDIRLNPLPVTMTCPVNTDCQTRLTVLVNSTPGRVVITFGAHPSLKYNPSPGQVSSEYSVDYDSSTPVTDRHIVVPAIVRGTSAGQSIISVPISAEIT